MSEQISGNVEEIVYTSESTGYTVCIIDCGGEPVTLVGTIPYISEGEFIKAIGVWSVHPTFGRQFRVEAFEKELPEDEDAIFRYLSSGSIRGLGPVTARRIIDRFGNDTISVMENHPEWLAEIRGITKAKALQIGESFSAQFGAREAMIFLGKYFGPNLSIKIYKKYKSAAPDLIRLNPYRLCTEIQGIGFEKADSVAHDLGFPADSEERISAGICHILMNAAYGDGHCYLPYNMLAESCLSLLRVGKPEFDSALRTCVQYCRVAKIEPGYGEGYALAKLYDAERYAAAKLMLLKENTLPFPIEGIREQIEVCENKQGIKYDEIQIQAIENAITNGVSIVTGGPGTGKTTVIKAIIDILDCLGVKYMLASPTGRAAKRMSDACGKDAKTIHRLLETGYGEDGVSVFARNEDNPLNAKVYIIDETSMVDSFLMEAFLRALKNDAMVIFIGDSDQLPPVGPGNALNDMIESGYFSVTRLNRIFRQAEKSLIIVNAHKINNGEEPDIKRKDGDFFFIEKHDSKSLRDLVCDLVKTRLPNAYKLRPLDDIQIISPTRRGECGTYELNRVLQEAINPKSPYKKEKKIRDTVFRDGDKVMQVKNNYDLVWEKGNEQGNGIFNGDIGRVISVDVKSEVFYIDFDGRLTEYDFLLADDLELAYAVTVHKSQGSEYPAVIIPMLQCPNPLKTRNLLYTAVTRAKQLLIAVGDSQIMMSMTRNYKKALRFTSLPRLFRVLNEEN